MPSAEFGPSVHYAPRRAVLGGRGACATSHPLAVEAGLHLLRSGGSAADAAVGMAAVLTVVEPTSNGLGSDAFALVWAQGALHGLNGSGRAPGGLTDERLAREPGPDMPVHGWSSVTVPGAPAAWRDLHDRFGRLSFEAVLAPAVEIAEGGHPVAPVVAHYWERAASRLAASDDLARAGWAPTFTVSGRAPRAGETWRAPDHARTLRRMAETGATAFYEGDLAAEMVRFSRETGGTFDADDLATHRSDWVEPMGMDYRGATLWEIPPNGQGIVALSALGMLRELPPPGGPLEPAGVHRAVEAVKAAFADARATVADPSAMRVTPESLLDADYLRERASGIGERAVEPDPGEAARGGTVYLAAADADGMMVSFIQSNFMGFGSGIVVPGTGIGLQNRAAGFTRAAGHPNAPAPGKRPFHTIIPGFLTRDGEPWGPMGVMGGHMQPQGHVQVVRALVDHGLDPQAALDLPRWHWEDGLRLVLEDARPGGGAWPEASVADLRKRGHDLRMESDPGRFGRGQIILRLPDGGYAAGSDWRADGLAGVY